MPAIDTKILWSVKKKSASEKKGAPTHLHLQVLWVSRLNILILTYCQILGRWFFETSRRSSSMRSWVDVWPGKLMFSVSESSLDLDQPVPELKQRSRTEPVDIEKTPSPAPISSISERGRKKARLDPPMQPYETVSAPVRLAKRVERLSWGMPSLYYETMQHAEFKLSFIFSCRK